MAGPWRPPHPLSCLRVSPQKSCRRSCRTRAAPRCILGPSWVSFWRCC
ncbi:hypothetical protein FKM82_026419 [Ascaphus truei]